MSDQVPTARQTLKQVEGAVPWTSAEQRLLAECGSSEVVSLPGDARPAAPTDANSIRAGLIAFLLLGGDDEHRPHPKGVMIARAVVTGVLDLNSCRIQLDLYLSDCLIPGCPDLMDARLGALFLDGCHLPQGLNAHRLRTDGNVHLRNGFRADGPVDLGGAHIGGALACNGGTFRHPRAAKDSAACALKCDAARIGADVFLSGTFTAEGQVTFVRADIGGQLACNGGTFHHPRAAQDSDARALNCDAARIGADVFLRDGFTAAGQVDFIRASITGNLMVTQAKLTGTFDGEGMTIGGGLFWRDIAPRPKIVDLTEAKVGALRDDWGSWDGVTTLHLTGFRYDRIVSAITPAQRIDLLGRQSFTATNPHFDPGAHTQLAKALRQSGDRRGAAQAAFDRECRLQRAERQSGFPSLWKWSFRATFGFGHKPIRAVYCLAVVWLFIFSLAFQTFHSGQMAPNSAVILASPEWATAMAGADACPKARTDDCLTPTEIWNASAGAATDWETFSAILYATDLLLPVLDTGMVAAWAPSKDRGNWGRALYWARTPVQIIGWTILLIGAAVVTGVVGRREEE